MLMLIFAFIRGTTSEDYNIREISLLASFVTFCLLTSLFLFQVKSNVSYLIKNILPSIKEPIDYSASVNDITNLTQANLVIALGLLTILPVFWFNLTLSLSEILMVVGISLMVMTYTIAPVLKLKSTLKEQVGNSRFGVEANSNTVESSYASDSAYLSKFMCKSNEFRKALKTITAFGLIFVSWILVSMIELIL
ncbi:hypothetical protein Q4561_06860 [Alteromonas sp. 1_MG-2023]|uniref:hypothetical protein n=1 Tax=Alteromonas sp. 1_MG-2023 TaxID=3062669 RepID=UPI0026E27494|nr:hypothetical protein [Alteromonas sp. 1_MG-2023]MDO6566772.1 hypothetical protein [Alteromonas sp. 1_MG-2023]